MKIIISIYLLMLSIFTFGQNSYEFHPQSSLKLGRGFDKDDFSDVKLEALSYTIDSNNVALNSFVKSYLVFDENSLTSKLHIDQHVEARYLVYEGSSDFTFDKNTFQESNSLSLLIECGTEFGRTTLKDPKLLQPADDMLKNKDYATFKERYGTDFVVETRRGVYVYALITIHNMADSSINAIKFSSAGKGTIEVVDVKTNMTISSEITEASKSGRLTVDILAKGGKGISELKNVIPNLAFRPNSLENIQKELSNYIESLDASYSVPLTFFTKKFDDVQLKKYDIWDEQREDLLLEVSDEYKKLNIIKNQISYALNPANKQLLLIEQAQQNKLTSLLPEVKVRLKQLAKIHKTILNGADIDTVRVPEKLEINIANLIPQISTFSLCETTTDHKLWVKADSNGNYPTYHGKLILESQTHKLYFPDDLLYATLYSDLNSKNSFRAIKNIKIICGSETVYSFSKSNQPFKLDYSGLKSEKGLYNFEVGSLFDNSAVYTITKFISDKINGEKNSNGKTSGEINLNLEIDDIFGNSSVKSFSNMNWYLNDSDPQEVVVNYLGDDNPDFNDVCFERVNLEFNLPDLPATDTLYFYFKTANGSGLKINAISSGLHQYPGSFEIFFRENDRQRWYLPLKNLEISKLKFLYIFLEKPSDQVEIYVSKHRDQIKVDNKIVSSYDFKYVVPLENRIPKKEYDLEITF